MADLKCDVAVIGAGTAGIAAERAAREAGASTLLIDPEFAGTVCANVGCMPSKLMIAAGNVAQAARDGGVFGINAVPKVDGPAVMARLRHERDAFVAGVLRTIDKIPEEIRLKTRARFDGPQNLVLEDGRRVAARAVVIATGSDTIVPEPYRDLGEAMLTNASVFELEDLPRSLAVIGAGVIGLELAQAMARLGVEVAVFDRADALSISRSEAVNDTLKKALERDLSLHLGTSPEPAREGDQVRIDWDKQSALFDKVLVATGRPPSVKDLGLETTGALLDNNGVPEFDRETMQIRGLPIFIAGDANADRPVLHEASMEGNIAGRNAARAPDTRPTRRMPFFSVTFTHPTTASIGAGPGGAAGMGVADYGNQGRARVENCAHGRVEIYSDANNCLIGADLCAPGGEHLAHLLLWAIEERVTAQEMLRRPFYHPTLEEGLKSALRQICSCTGFEEPSDRDVGPLPGA